MKVEIVSIFEKPFVKTENVTEEMPYVVLNNTKYISLKDKLEEILGITLTGVFVTEEFILCDVKDYFIPAEAIQNLIDCFNATDCAIIIGYAEDGPTLEIKIKLI